MCKVTSVKPPSPGAFTEVTLHAVPKPFRSTLSYLGKIRCFGSSGKVTGGILITRCWFVLKTAFIGLLFIGAVVTVIRQDILSLLAVAFLYQLNDYSLPRGA